jgi:hypothetical protein
MAVPAIPAISISIRCGSEVTQIEFGSDCGSDTAAAAQSLTNKLLNGAPLPPESPAHAASDATSADQVFHDDGNADASLKARVQRTEDLCRESAALTKTMVAMMAHLLVDRQNLGRNIQEAIAAREEEKRVQEEEAAQRAADANRRAEEVEAAARIVKAITTIARWRKKMRSQGNVQKAISDDISVNRLRGTVGAQQNTDELSLAERIPLSSIKATSQSSIFSGSLRSSITSIGSVAPQPAIPKPNDTEVAVGENFYALRKSRASNLAKITATAPTSLRLPTSSLPTQKTDLMSNVDSKRETNELRAHRRDKARLHSQRKESRAGRNSVATSDHQQLAIYEHLLESTQQARPPFMISSLSPLRHVWDTFILVLVLYTVFEAPFTAAFLTGDPSPGMAALDASMVACFSMDLISNFFTSFELAEEEVFDKSAIAHRYVVGPWFWVDLLSSLPTELFEMMLQGDGVDPALLKGFKLFRMVRLGKMMKHYDDIAFASAFRILRLCFFIVLFMHWGGCGWALVMSDDFKLKYSLLLLDCAGCSSEDSGLPDWAHDESVDIATLVGQHVIEAPSCCKHAKASVTFAYSTCIFSAVSSVLGLGAFFPITITEKFFSSILSLFGACLQACVFGSVAVVIAGLDGDETTYNQKLAQVTSRMRHLGLPMWLRHRVIAYYDMARNLENCGAGAGDSETDSFLSDLSPSLQSDIKLCMFRSLIANVPFFSHPEVRLYRISDSPSTRSDRPRLFPSA